MEVGDHTHITKMVSTKMNTYYMNISAQLIFKDVRMNFSLNELHVCNTKTLLYIHCPLIINHSWPLVSDEGTSTFFLRISNFLEIGSQVYLLFAGLHNKVVNTMKVFITQHPSLLRI